MARRVQALRYRGGETSPLSALDEIKLEVAEGDRLKTDDDVDLKGLDKVEYVQAIK